MTEISQPLLEKLHALGVKNELGGMAFPQGTAGEMTFDICLAIAALETALAETRTEMHKIHVYALGLEARILQAGLPLAAEE